MAQHFNLPYFRLTDYGKRAVNSEKNAPHDTSKYLSEIRAAAQICGSPVTLSYLEEALLCFMRTYYTAAVLLLGVAAEAAFLELSAVLARSVRDARERSGFEKMDTVKKKHRWVVQKYTQLPANIRRQQLPDGLDITLTGIYDLIRRQRNELGHPQLSSPDIDREHAFNHFFVFPTFLSDAEAFAVWCQANGI